MTSPPQTAAAAAVEPRCRDSGTATRGQPVSMADHWSLMMSEVPLMSSLTGGEGRGGNKASGTWVGLRVNTQECEDTIFSNHKETQVT